MADKQFTLNIVTPAKTVFSGDVTSFTAPGVVGSFQVLFNHAPLMSSIDIGEVKVVEANGTVSHFATSGGFVEVKGNNVILLAETAEHKNEIDVARAEQAKKRAADLLAKKENVDQERARAALTRAINRLKVAQR